MTHTYKVSGMTCNNCKASVEAALSQIPEVKSVLVNLEKSEAKITMTSHVEVEKLQHALPDRYQISEAKETNVFGSSSSFDEASKKSEIKQLYPLFLIFGYIIIASILMNYKFGNSASFMLDFMGLFFIVFSFFKFLDLNGFVQSFKMYDPLAKKNKVYGWMYPFIELALGLAFLYRFKIKISLIVTLVILVITTIGVTKAILSKSKIQCACLGTVLKLPMTKATLIENSIMIIMAVIMLIKIYL